MLTETETETEAPSSLTSLIDAAQTASREVHAQEWEELDQILARADAPEVKDGQRLLLLAAKLSIPANELKSLAELARRRQRLQAELDRLAAATAEQSREAAAVRDELSEHRRGLLRLKADRERMLVDLPAEVVKLREAAKLLTAVADTKGTGGRDAFLQSRGWISVYVNGLPLMGNYRPAGGGHVVEVHNALGIEAAAILANLGPQSVADDVRLDAAIGEGMPDNAASAA